MIPQKPFGTYFCSFGLHWDRYGALMVPQRSFGFHLGPFGLHYYWIHGFLVFLGTLWYSYGTTKALMVPLWYPYGTLIVPLWYLPMVPLFSHFSAFFSFVALLAPLWSPYGTLMVPPHGIIILVFFRFFLAFCSYGTLMVPYGTLMVPYGTLMVPPKQHFLNCFVGPVLPFSYEFYGCFFDFRCEWLARIMFFDSFRRKWMLDVLTWFSLENNVFFEVFDEINCLFRSFLEEKSDFSQKNQRKRNFLREKSDSWTENRSFLEEKSDFRCLWYPYGTPKRPKRYHKLQKERFCSRKERLGIQKSLFFRTKSLFFKLMVPLWYQMGFRSASFGTISTFLYPYGTSHWGWIHGISVRKCLEKQQFQEKNMQKTTYFTTV